VVAQPQKLQQQQQQEGDPTLEPLQLRFERMSEEDRIRKVLVGI